MKDLKKIGKRLFQFMEKKSIGVNELGRLTNTSGAQISNIIKGKKYGVDKLLNIFDRFPELNIYWLLTGKGEMLISKPANASAFSEAEALKIISDLKATNEKLVSDVKSLKTDKDKLSKGLEYQSQTIEAYKKTIEIQSESITDLKEMLSLFKGTSSKELRSKSA